MVRPHNEKRRGRNKVAWNENRKANDLEEDLGKM